MVCAWLMTSMDNNACARGLHESLLWKMFLLQMQIDRAVERQSGPQANAIIPIFQRFKCSMNFYPGPLTLLDPLLTVLHIDILHVSMITAKGRSLTSFLIEQTILGEHICSAVFRSDIFIALGHLVL